MDKKVKSKREKLYIIRDSNRKIFALSESKREVENFFIQNNYQNANFTITIVTDSNVFNSVALSHYDLFITEFYNDFYVRYTDMKPIMDMIYSEEESIRKTIETLTRLSNDRRVIKTSIMNSMYDVSKYLSKHIKDIVDVYGIISTYYNTPSIMDNYREYEKYLTILC